jgi:hypothetical protein
MGQLALMLLILDTVFGEGEFPYLIVECPFQGWILLLD